MIDRTTKLYGYILGGVLALAIAGAPVQAHAKLGTNGKSLNGATLNGVDFNGATLNGATLNGATLNGRRVASPHAMGQDTPNVSRQVRPSAFTGISARNGRLILDPAD